MTELRRVAVVNRGEAAMRLVNAVRELRVEHGIDLRAIALHTRAERGAMFVREADEAVCIDDGWSPGVGSPYLDLATLERALLEARADSAWVGWGFVAERPEFADLCDRLGVVFVGPRGDVMRRLGDKIGSKLLAEEAGVPVAPWSGGPVDDLAAARRHAADIGYPLMIKATAGGGGRGIRRVDDDVGLAEAFEGARSEGGKAFGDPTVFMERVVRDARHVEVQLIADDHGAVWAVGVRDCSLQRRNQKVIEESRCMALSADQDLELREAACRLALAAGYSGAGTVEFLYQPAEQRFSFLEVNTRLQVEHPVTELTTGLDLVKLQLHVAAGGHLEGEPPPTEGYAIEARLNAEDPQHGFAPAPGTIDTLTLPVGPGIRVDTGVTEGDVIPPEYDSMIAKVIAHGRTRSEALARLHRALSQMSVIVRGGTTNKSFLLDLLDRPEVRAGDIDTSWLDRLTAADEHIPSSHADVALVAAALDAADLQAGLDRAAFLGWAGRGRPQTDLDIGQRLELRFRGQSYPVELRRLSGGRAEVELDGVVAVVDVERLGRGRSRLDFGDRRFTVVSSVQGSDHLIEVEGVAHRFSRDDAGIVRAQAAALIVAVHVVPDDVVETGTRLGVVEAMKMEIAVTAPIGGRVRDVFVNRNMQVDAGAPLFRIEPVGEAGTAEPLGHRVALDALQRRPATEPQEQCRNALATVRAFVLGFDVDSSTARRAVTEACRVPGWADIGGLAVLGSFADLLAVSPERRAPDESEIRGPRELFNAYLRSLDAQHEGLPAWFEERLRRALANYGVTSLDRSPALEEALLRIFLAQQRRPEQEPVITALLDELAEASSSGTVSASSDEGLGDALDHLIDASRRRLPAVASLARGVRHRRFDRLHADRARAEVGAIMRTLAAGLTGADLAPDELERLVDGPLPLVPLLAEQGILAGTDDASQVLEVLTRRYYRIRDLGPVASVSSDIVRASYRHKGRTVHVLALRAFGGGLDGAVKDAGRALADVAPPDTAVVDIYLPLPAAATATTDQLAAEVAAALRTNDLPMTIRRVALVASHPDAPNDVLTFRRIDGTGEQPYWMGAGAAGAGAAGAGPAAGDESRTDDGSGSGFAEDVMFRGLHPMIARRLQMWRLENFEISRLPAAGEVHLFHCTGRENRSDERLIALAEVRDVTPVLDDHGRIVAVPEVELVLVEALDAIRDALAAQPRLQRLEWNRVMLHVWPLIDLPLEELTEVARRLVPLTDGLGLEQVIVSGRFAGLGPDPLDMVLRLSYEPGRGLTIRMTDPPDAPMQPLDDYTRKLIQTRRRGLVYPYELVPMICREGGTFAEHDLDEDGRLVPVDRAPGRNEAGVVVGVVRTPTTRYPEGMARVVVLGDPTKAMGSITEAECRRVLGAIDLAAQLDLPIEWFAVSAGAKIAMDSGSENLDWVARVLRRLVEHTQRGGEVNVVVAGINVGAQPYWNAEATMLMHTRGILVMNPDSAMVLTGKQAIDYSGGVSAEDNLGIGGYARVMGPNGEAQYWAPSLATACDVLLSHYELTYRAPGERWPRPAPTTDPSDRDVRTSPHVVEGVEFTKVGDIFSAEANPDRKKPFDIRTLMSAVVDQDHPPLERWPEMADAETAVVQDARLGGHAVTVIGIESRPLPRHGTTPADGPAQWSAGTLFPLSSKKVARAINAASGGRPVVVLANLSGFDGSPESLRRLQLEYGAEIGRAIVNFDGPIVLCVVSRYHGGAFVVFSATLNDDMEVLAVEGSFASVIGGAPAAAVVFTREVDHRTRTDERVRALEAAASQTAPHEVGSRLAELSAVRDTVRTEKLGEVAAEFDAVHSVQRAKEVGSVHRIIAAADLRPELIAAVERGMKRVVS